MKIGDRIKNRREELDMSQEDLALKLGYKSRSSINKIEKDASGLPQSKIVDIAKALHTTPAYIMGWEESQNDQPLHKPVSEEDLKIALFGGEGEVTDDMWEEVKRFAEFVKQKNMQ